MLVVIGTGWGWINAHDCAGLPSALRTLHCLARLDRSTLELLIADGTIRRRLTEREAKEIVEKFKGHQNKPRKYNVEQRVRLFAAFVRDTITMWQPEEREALPPIGSMTLDEVEKAMILKAMKHHDGNISRVAEALGLSRAALYRRFEKYEIEL